MNPIFAEDSELFSIHPESWQLRSHARTLTPRMSKSRARIPFLDGTVFRWTTVFKPKKRRCFIGAWVSKCRCRAGLFHSAL
jgi:hypothetical protein